MNGNQFVFEHMCKFEGCHKRARWVPELHVPYKDASQSTLAPRSILLAMFRSCDTHWSSIPSAKWLANRPTVVATFLRLPNALSNPLDYDNAFVEKIDMEGEYFRRMKATADAARKLQPGLATVTLEKTRKPDDP